MKQNLQTNNGPGAARAQTVIGYLAVTVLLAALAFGAREYARGQQELARQLADAETVGRLEEMDAISHAIGLMNNSKVNEARQELQVRLDDGMQILHSELPLANARIQLFAADLCDRVAKMEASYSAYSMSLQAVKPQVRRTAERIDE